jgi:hypothetical protein
MATAIPFVFMNNPKTVLSVGIVHEHSDIRITWRFPQRAPVTRGPRPFGTRCGMPPLLGALNKATSPLITAISQMRL